MKKKSALLLLLCLILPPAVTAENYKWEPKGDEPAFSLDIPNDWEIDYLVKTNGSLVFFRHAEAVIEVRSYLSEDDAEFQTLMNQKAARLSARYNDVRLINEKKSKYRSNMYLAAWRLLDEKNRLYIEKTAFISDGGEQVLAISCIAPRSAYNRYKVTFDNAILSLKLNEFEREEPKNGIFTLKSLYIFNRPNAENLDPSQRQSGSN